jgi:hypothetical protein
VRRRQNGLSFLRAVRTAFAVTASLPLAALIVATSCSSSVQTPSDTRPRGPFYLDASCSVTVDDPPLLPASHVDVGTTVTYDSNPPSSGPHYPYWAAYRAYTTPVDRRYYVHNLEHGAIVFLYRCDQPAGCPDAARAMQAAADSLPDDPLCAKFPGVRVRTVITPDPLLDTPYAAAAWGWTYKSSCIDAPTLKQFAHDHYAQAPENLCEDGTAQF